MTPFECPELLEIAEKEAAALDKVRVSYGETPEHLVQVLNQGPTFEANENELLLRVKTVGRYLVRNGSEIIITKEEGTGDDEIRLFLFGSAIGALLQQRGYLTLHASGIKTAKGAVLFAGHSGAGKSTTLQEFLRRGYKKLSDDTVAMYYDEKQQQVVCLPSYPQSKLWQESADMLQLETEALRRIRPELKKFALPTAEYFHDAMLPLHAIYILSTHNKQSVDIEEVANLQRFNAIKNHTYRKKFLEKLPQRRNHFQISTKVAQGYRVKRLIRPDKAGSLKVLADLVESDFS